MTTNYCCSRQITIFWGTIIKITKSAALKSNKEMASSIMMMIMIAMVSPSSSSPNFLNHFCSNTTTYDSNSSFPTNLNTLLTYLSSNASTSPTGFYSTSVGRAANDTVYGFFMCRGDQNTGACSDCVATAVKDHKETSTCPIGKEHVIFYDQCMLRYDDRVLVGRLDSYPIFFLTNSRNITRNQTGFQDLVLNTMNTLLTPTETNNSGKKYATTAVDFPSTFQTLYALEQCVPDLAVNDCDLCLKYANSYLPIRQGARVMSPSCNVRYEIYPFFNGAYNLTLPPPPPSPPMVNITPPSTGQTKDGNKVSIGVIIAVVIPIATILVALLMLGICLIRRKAEKYDSIVVDSNAGDDPAEEISLIESIQYDLDTLQSATLNFSEENKLGEGGFGAVYKGTLTNGQEIAVKKLSKSSTQGLREFKNEALLVAKLQHRNLVKLLGFCVAGEEKLLIYEFVVNKSLDKFLFDPEKQGLLDWETRHRIIQGIARGLLYLHHDSRLTIIHRDLKASNVLLDTNLNPKISDFGLARIFGIDQTQGDTSRIVGTYGYMSPEYAMQGHFSTKSDVYSFGVIVLEIISGKKNSSFYQTDKGEDLLSYAWNLWKEGSLMDLVDPTIRNSCSSHEVMRCIHLGLLCVQEFVSERPTMATIVLMLDSISITLPVPQQPSFTFKNRTMSNFSKESGSDKSSSKSAPWSMNDVSITEPEPR